VNEFSNRTDLARETVLEIDLGALKHNYTHLRSKLKKETKFLGVVKAFAYGSDAVQIAKKLEVLGIDYFAVAYVDEGIALRKSGIKTPILVLHPLPASFEKLIKHCLEPSLYSPKILDEFLKTAQKGGQKHYPVHLKFNTGLNRLGFSENDVEFISAKLNQRDEIRVVSIFSHLAASEDLNEKQFTKNQIGSFQKISKEITEKFSHKPFRHLLNTSGIINYPEAQFDMVRSGIGLYGFGNESKVDAELKPVATLKTVISQLHKIEPGESVGYNRGFVSNGPRITATLPVGHADGIGRQYGNGNAYVTIGGKKTYVVGNICMDMIMVDVTGIDCKAGDEVIIFGADQTAEHMAKGANTISYELLTGISQRVKRIIRDE